MYIPAEIITKPPVYPVTVDEIKKAMGVYCDDDDDRIEGILAAAVDWAQTYQVRRVFVEQGWEAYPPYFPSGAISLPRINGISIEYIKYKDYTGTEYTIDSEKYILTHHSDIIPAYGESWPCVSLYPADPITIRFTAGYKKVIGDEIKEESIGTGDGEETLFALANTPIEEGSATIYIEDVEVEGYTLDLSTGLITFELAPEEGAVITGDYKIADDYRTNIPSKIKQGIIMYCRYLDYVYQDGRDGIAENLLKTAEVLLTMDRGW